LRPLPNGQKNPEIVFWEKNGLRHGEFNLTGATKVFSLSFNLESTLLAIHCIKDDIE